MLLFRWQSPDRGIVVDLVEDAVQLLELCLELCLQGVRGQLGVVMTTPLKISP